jgi:UDP:flavonoid glycosyltransferase YjiC (YdhE family)
MTIEAVQQILNRSRASVYRYANTEPDTLNLPYNPKKLNPELRHDHQEALRFHPNEVARFARDILQLKPVIIHAQESPESLNTRLLQEILQELRTLNAQIARLNPPN